MFEIVLNVLNVVVGLVGGYLAVVGVRMPRTAAIPQRRADGS